jgi:hypothetical protein
VAAEIPVLSDALFALFGGTSWVFLPATDPLLIADDLDADIVDQGQSWGTNPHAGEGPGVLVLTSPIRGWMLLEGASETVGDAAVVLSQDRGVFRATVDVRLPAMSWAHLEGGMPTRTVSVELGDDGDLVTRTTGPPRPFEAADLVCPTSEHGFDPFFYPVAILDVHGVRLMDLERAMVRPTVTLQLR